MSEGSYDGPSADDIRRMTPEEAMVAGAEVDGVRIAHRRDRFPVRGTKAERRAERGVALAFTIGAIAGLAFVVIFVAAPWHWQLPGRGQHFKYFTPLLGGTLALMLILFGVGLVLWAKWLMPEEEVIQDRHELPSTEEEKLLTEATLVVGLEDTGIARRSSIKLALLAIGGALATAPLVLLVGGMLKKPGTKLLHTLYDPKWAPEGEEYVPLVYDDWRRVGPGDMLPGAVATVFPGVRQEVAGKTGVTDAKSPTLLIRLRPGQKMDGKKGQENFGWPPENPEYVAFSKICTHAGCPASLYEQQTTRLLCPCHQSQFEVLKDAKPVFGPATRSLPKLPLTVVTGEDGKQYFAARSDYHEAIGPAFWERR